MKAWRVFDKDCTTGTEIIFAETRGKAISYALSFKVSGPSQSVINDFSNMIHLKFTILIASRGHIASQFLQ